MGIFNRAAKTLPKMEPYGRCEFEISGDLEETIWDMV
jgi:hypothetical protein